MSRSGLKAPIRGWIAVACAGCAIAVAGCGSATSSSAGAGATPTTTPAGATTSHRTTAGASALTVSPAHGGPRTRFSLRFVAPASAGAEGSSRLGFTLSVTGGSGSGGCIGARTVSVPAATKGIPVAIALNPASLGGSWCPGRHTARVVEVQGPICNPGTMCPQYLRVVGTVGETTFTVSRTA
jgi:hypothetical protein